jgi:hypothetical protein
VYTARNLHRVLCVEPHIHIAAHCGDGHSLMLASGPDTLFAFSHASVTSRSSNADTRVLRTYSHHGHHCACGHRDLFLHSVKHTHTHTHTHTHSKGTCSRSFTFNRNEHNLDLYYFFGSKIPSSIGEGRQARSRGRGPIRVFLSSR